MTEHELLTRITCNPKIFGDKAIAQGHCLAVEHFPDRMAAEDTKEDILQDFPWLEKEDIQACIPYAARMVGNEAP
jgi:uncharacterized protein (DUF433 family)